MMKIDRPTPRRPFAWGDPSRHNQIKHRLCGNYVETAMGRRRSAQHSTPIFPGFGRQRVFRYACDAF
jgi:hypothetical protein